MARIPATAPSPTLRLDAARVNALEDHARRQFLRKKDEDLLRDRELAYWLSDLERQTRHLIQPPLFVARGVPAAQGRGVSFLADFHSHWDGILPVDRLIDLYREQASASMKGEEWMFLRLSGAILAEKGMPKNGKPPTRGAHLFQYVMIYVAWAVYLEGALNGYGDLRPPHEWAHQDYGALHGAAMTAIVALSRAYASEEGRGSWLRRALAMKALHKYLRASKTAPFDDAYVGRGALLKQLPRDRFDAATVEYLVDAEHIRYLQVSQPADKIAAPAGAIDEFNAGNPDRRITVHWLALIPSHRDYLASTERDDPSDAIPPRPPRRERPQEHDKSTKVSESDKTMKEKWEKVCADTSDAMKKIRDRNFAGGTVRGLDWAGPENKEFQLQPARKLVKKTLGELHLWATRDRPLVFRPHVGEGSSLREGGSLIEADPGALMELISTCFLSSQPEWRRMKDAGLAELLCGHRVAREVLRHRDDSFKVLADGERTRDGRPSDEVGEAKEAARRARRNVGTLTFAIRNYYDPKPPPGSLVKIRFGHVTHATPRQAQWMNELGIAADVNLSSNERTGALAYLEHLEDADERKSLWGSWSSNPAEMVRPSRALRQPHSILPLWEKGVVVVLGSDGQGVESSRLPHEYVLARNLLIDDDRFWGVMLQNTLDQQLL